MEWGVLEFDAFLFRIVVFFWLITPLTRIKVFLYVFQLVIVYNCFAVHQNRNVWLLPCPISLKYFDHPFILNWCFSLKVRQDSFFLSSSLLLSFLFTAYVFVHYVCLMYLNARRGYLNLWKYSFRQVLQATVVLRIKPRFPGTLISHPNYWVFSKTSRWVLIR